MELEQGRAGTREVGPCTCAGWSDCAQRRGVCACLRTQEGGEGSSRGGLGSHAFSGGTVLCMPD